MDGQEKEYISIGGGVISSHILVILGQGKYDKMD